MSLYHIVFLLLLFGVLIEYYKGKTPKGLFFLCFAVLTAMLCFRYGQGTDYAAYRMIYYTMPTSIAGTISYSFAKAEIGWRLLCMIFRRVGISFEMFVFLLSAVQMVLLWRFLSRYCKNKILALFLGYHTLYLTYMFSAMRQGTVILIFLGVLLQWLLDGKLVRYCIAAALCLSIHSVAVILFFPAILQLVRFSVERLIALVIVGSLLGVLLSIFDVGVLLARIGVHYTGESAVSIFALAERLASFVLVTYLYYLYNDGMAPSEKDPFFKLYEIYAFGIFIYGLLMWSPLISSRMIYALKALEIPLISTCIVKSRKARSIVMLYCVLLCSVMYIKKISSNIAEAQYVNTTVWNFPYISIWNWDKILACRANTSQYFDWLLVNR